MANPPSFSLAQSVQQLRTSWGGSQEGMTRTWAGTGAISYYIGGTPNNSGTGEFPFLVAMTTLMQQRAALAFELWDDLIARNLTPAATAAGVNIQFEYASSTFDGNGQLSDRGGTYARAFTTGGGGTNQYGTTNLNISKQEIWLNSHWTSHDTDADMIFGGYGLQTYIHEIGHTLGLSHPGTYNAGNNPITYVANAEFLQDTRQYTVMSYFQAGSDGQGNIHGGSYSSTPLLYDIAAIQAMYGADLATRTGATTYGFNVTADLADRPMFNFALNTSAIVAIYDSGGIDTLDVSGFTQPQTIDLRPGTFSSIGALTNNLAVAYAVTNGGVVINYIENAVGGPGNDTITGNDADNILRGGRGNDTIDGGAGTDSAVFAGLRSAYTLAPTADGVQVTGPDGTDTLKRVERLVFDDVTETWPPTVAAQPDLTVTNGSVSDDTPNPGQGITVNYRVNNVGTGNANGFHVGVFLSTDATITVGDTLLGFEQLGALAGGGQNNRSLVVTIPNSVTIGGQYWIGIIADDVNQVTNEISENNNGSSAIAITIPAPLQPDLTAFVTGVSVTTPNPGQQVTVSFQIDNINSGAAGGFNAGVYLSTDATISTADTLLGAKAIAALAGNTTATDSLLVTLPGTLTPGSAYFIGVIADHTNVVTNEVTESNNPSTGFAIAIPLAGQADLIAWQVAVSDSTPDPGQSVTVTYRIDNLGTTAAGEFFAGLYLSVDAAISTADALIGYEYFPSLSGGEFGTGSITADLPTTLTPGTTYYLGVIADDTNLITGETSESNNASTGAAISVPSATQPDLTASNVAVSDTTPDPGQQITVTYRVNNNASGAADIFYAGIYLSTDPTIGLNDTLLAFESFDGLAANAFANGSVSVILPSYLTTGATYYIGVIADDLDEVPGELSETNNASAGVAVTAPQSSTTDLTASNIVVSDTTPVPGQSISVQYRVNNIGTGMATEFFAGLYLSTNPTIDLGDALLGYESFDSLAGGSFDTGQIFVDLPTWIAPGTTYYIGVIADDLDEVQLEANENNNASAGTAIVVSNEARPDLTASNLTVSDDTPAPGQSITVNYRINNIGKANAGVFYAGVYISDDDFIDPAEDPLVDDFSFESFDFLNAGTSVAGSLVVTLADTLTPGATYWIGVVADDIDEVTNEISENNNYSDPVAITLAGGDDFAGNTGTAGQVAVGGAVSGTLEVSGDRDWFRVQLVAGANYTIRLSGAPSGAGTLADPYLYLYNAAGSLIAENDDSPDSLESRLSYTATATGTFYVGAGGYGGGTGTYVVSVATGIAPPIVGDDNNNTLIGTPASETINGLGGDDTLAGLDGDDSMLGGDGIDYLTGGPGDDTMSGGSGSDALHAEDGNDNVHGDDGDDVLVGLGGNDVLNGDAGNDTLIGGDGADFLGGSSGVDQMFGGNGNDVLSGGTEGDFLSGGGGDDSITGGDGADSIHGEDGNDNAFGDAGDDVLVGYLGNDALNGGAGHDTLIGNAGADTLNGDEGNDQIFGYEDVDVANGGTGDDFLAGGAGNDTLHGNDGGDVLDGEADDDQLFGDDGGDNLNGNFGNDVLYGGAGNDGLTGRDGSDILDGGAGNDFLIGDRAGGGGSPGNDIFVFHLGTGNDNIADFQGGAGLGDVIDIREFGFADLAALLPNATDVGGGVYILLRAYTVPTPATDAIFLENFTKANLAANDFMFT